MRQYLFVTLEKYHRHHLHMSKLTGGLINEVSRRGSVIVKKFSEESVIQGLGFSAKQRFTNEISAFERIGAETTLHIPKLFTQKESSMVIEMELIEGQLLEELVLHSSKKKKDALYRDVAIELTKVHALTGITGTISYKDKFEEYLNRSKKILKNENVDIGKITKILNTHSSLLICNSPSLIHGDFWFNNIIYSDKKELFFIDWEFSSYGSLYEDLGVFYTNVSCYFEYAGGDKIFYKSYQGVTGRSLKMDKVRLFGIYRCIRLLSFISLETYVNFPTNYPHNFKNLVEIIRKTIKTFD